jgi:hypothetical protein
MDNQVSKLIDNLYNKDKLTLIEQPQNLQATLRPYQLRGLAWLDYLESIGKSIVVYYVQLNWFNKVRVDFDKFIEMNDCEFLNLLFIVKC